jgi:predicted PurR-regulated permease PerM
MNEGNPQTPFQEAVSIISIAAILVGLGCYVAAVNNVPLVSAFLFWVAVQVYNWLTALNALRASQVPMLIAALTVGTVFFIFTIPLAYWLAGVFSRAGINSIERQTARLKRLRDERKRRTRDHDDFRVA